MAPDRTQVVQPGQGPDQADGADPGTSPGPGPGPSSSPSPSPSRDPYFDNAKLLAVVLVVCGHFWEPLLPYTGERGVTALYLLTYAFHMPAFIVMSGYFSRSFAAQPRQMRRLVTGVLVPFLFWNTLLTGYTDLLNGQHVTLRPLTPVWITWFLMSLFLWRLTAPLWSTLRAPVAVATAVFLASGAFPFGAQLSLTRTLQFLPFFVLGLTIRPSRLAWLRETRWVRRAAVPVLAAALAAAYLLAGHLSPAWLYRSGGAHDLHVSYARWLTETTAIYAAALVLTAAFLSLIPRTRTWFTPLGAGTMYAFLIHAFLRETLIHTGAYPHIAHSASAELTLTATSVALALTLCTPRIRQTLRPLVEPRLTFLFRNP
ncbi:acyltransferase family protein [Streptomyces sp. CA-111067]|uniref:acyltransferase family protein n=1 Tax=Streptomyces sp. CA-111067 TaxID=3240046 RepID=UPI003D985AA3